jgi:hypothetical protein
MSPRQMRLSFIDLTKSACTPQPEILLYTTGTHTHTHTHTHIHWHSMNVKANMSKRSTQLRELSLKTSNRTTVNSALSFHLTRTTFDNPLSGTEQLSMLNRRQSKSNVQVNLFGIALGCGLDDRGSKVRFPARAGTFSLHHRVQNGSGVHAASYPVGTRGSFSGGKAAGASS